MDTLTSVTEQARTIANLCYEIQNLLRQKSLIRFFSESDIDEPLVTAAQGFQSFPIVFYGMHEHNMAVVGQSSLPEKNSLENKSKNWLSPGDVITGWYGPLVDKPRVIISIDLDGVRWRWFDDDSSVVREPVKLNKFFQSRGFIKLNLTAVDSAGQLAEITSIQANEIGQLEYYKNFLNEKSFLA